MPGFVPEAPSSLPTPLSRSPTNTPGMSTQGPRLTSTFVWTRNRSQTWSWSRSWYLSPSPLPLSLFLYIYIRRVKNPYTRWLRVPSTSKTSRTLGLGDAVFYDYTADLFRTCQSIEGGGITRSVRTKAGPISRPKLFERCSLSALSRLASWLSAKFGLPLALPSTSTQPAC